MRRVPPELKVTILEGIDVVFPRRDREGRKRPGFAAQLFSQGFDVVQVDVRVSDSVDELARLQVARLRMSGGRAAEKANDFEVYLTIAVRMIFVLGQWRFRSKRASN